MKTLLRRGAIALGVLVGVLAIAACAVYFVSERHVSRRYVVEAESIPIPIDSMSIARGQHLADAITKCTDCHARTLGGQVFIDNPALGRFVPTNLTRGKGGVGAVLTDADWVRAIRHGIGHDGHALRIMPSDEYQHLSVGDVGAIVAYMKSIPSVDNELPPSTLGPVGRTLVAAGQLPLFAAEEIDHAASRAPALAPDAGATKEYGAYLASVAGCQGCHGPTLSGGKIPGGDPAWVPAANITPSGLKAYDEASFFTALRTGVRPGGTKIKDPMPVAWTKEMTDDETRALWLYLKTVPAKEFGGR